jgi:hypothetical protein
MARKASDSSGAGIKIPTDPKKREEWVGKEADRLLRNQKPVGAGYAVVEKEDMPDKRAFSANLTVISDAMMDWVRSFHKLPQPPLPGIDPQRSFA